MSTANTLVVKGFINKIEQVSSGDKPKHFAKIAYSVGSGDSRQTQYLSCFVSKALGYLAQSTFETQTDSGDGKFKNVLGSQLAELTIVDPFFKVNDQGYLDGTGILTGIAFVTPDRQEKTSKGSKNA